MTADDKDRARRLLNDPDVRIHRLGLLERWLLPGALFGFFGWGGAELMRTGNTADFALGAVLIFGAAGIWVVALRVVLAFNDQDVLVRNLRSRMVLRRDITTATPTYEGLVLCTPSGRDLTAVAVQQYNVALMLGRRTRAARVADDLLHV